jgi:hypothetical protein
MAGCLRTRMDDDPVKPALLEATRKYRLARNGIPPPLPFEPPLPLKVLLFALVAMFVLRIVSA